MKNLKEKALYSVVIIGIIFLIYQLSPKDWQESLPIKSDDLTELNLLMREGYFPEFQSDPVAYKAFHDQIAKDLELKLNVDYYETNDQLLEILSDDTERLKYDVVMPSDIAVRKLIREKLIEPINSDEIPRITNIDDVFSDNERFQGLSEHSVPFAFQTTGLMSNAWKIEDILISWDYMFEAHKHEIGALKFSMPNDQRVSLGIALIYDAFRLNKALEAARENEIRNSDSKPIVEVIPDPNTTDKESIDRARDLIIEMIGKYDIRFGNRRDIYGRMMAEKVDIAVAWSGDAAKAMEQVRGELVKRARRDRLSSNDKNSLIKGEDYRDQIPKVRFTSPAPGVIVQFDCFAIVEGTSKRDLGLKFINFLLKPEVSAAVTNYSYYGNTNKHSRKYVDRNITNGPSYFTPALSDIYALEILDKETEAYYNEAWDKILATYRKKREKDGAIND